MLAARRRMRLIHCGGDWHCINAPQQGGVGLRSGRVQSKREKLRKNCGKLRKIADLNPPPLLRGRNAVPIHAPILGEASRPNGGGIQNAPSAHGVLP